MLGIGANVGRDKPPDWQDQLEASLRRAQDAMRQGVHQQDEMVRAWTDGLRTAYPDWGRERWQRKLERKLRKRAESEARIANASLFEGYAWTFGAVMMLIFALGQISSFWWLLFPAFWLGQRGARVLARHDKKRNPQFDPAVAQGQAQASGADPQAARARRFGGLGALGALGQNLEAYGQGLREEGPASDGSAARGRQAAGAPQPPIDPRDARVDSICDKILLELRDAPEPVREIFLKPEQTVAALRDTCKNLTRRERDVRRFLSPDEDARLVREKEVLQKRIDAETDEVTRMRLASALAALEQQREQRLELARSASRFEAEQTRISYTLESLYTQVVRMRSADAGSIDVAGAGLRRSLDLLSQEVNALADALEKVNAHDGPKAIAKAAPLASAQGDAQRMIKLGEAPSSSPDAPALGVPPALREKA